MAKTIGAARFKEQCLALLDSLDAEGIVITKHGKPEALIGVLADKLEIRGDILSTGTAWHAES